MLFILIHIFKFLFGGRKSHHLIYKCMNIVRLLFYDYYQNNSKTYFLILLLISCDIFLIISVVSLIRVISTNSLLSTQACKNSVLSQYVTIHCSLYPFEIKFKFLFLKLLFAFLFYFELFLGE